MRPNLSRCGTILFILAGLLVAGGALAVSGDACGNLGLVVTSDRVYGFSAAAGYWTSAVLDGSVVTARCSPYLGYVRTSRSVYAFNPNTNRWYTSTYAGLPAGESIEGSTIVFWTTSKAYAIASVWANWREQSFQGLSEPPRGGGSANSFGLVWTNRAAYAFNAASGNWIRQALDSPPLGGISSNGVGLVWTGSQAFAFDATPGVWRPRPLGNLQGVSASGSGDVCIIWADKDAYVYSADQSDWFDLQTEESILGGRASGDVAVIWTPHRAFGFSSHQALWGSVNLQGTLSQGMPALEIDSGELRIIPNPTRGTTEFSLPQSESVWEIGIFDADGARVARLAVGSGGSCRWNGRTDEDREIAAGTYWLRAASEGRVEVRRIVVLP